MKKLPKRSDTLIDQDVPGGLVVYDPGRAQAHFLNESAAVVFRHCDGRSGILAVARKVSPAAPVGASMAAVRIALDHLTRSGLVPERKRAEGGPSRRDFVKMWGKAAVVIPVIMSVGAPVPASAASACVTTPPGCTAADCTPCTTSATADGQCATKFCGRAYQTTGTSCADDAQGPVGCYDTAAGAHHNQDCAIARPNAVGGFYFCCIC